MKYVAAIALLVLTSLPPPVYAQDTLRLLPAYTACTDQGVRYACYTLEQQQQLNELEVRARHWQDRMHLLEQQQLVLRAQVVNAQQQLDTLQEELQIEHSLGERLRAQLEDEIRAKNRYRAEADSIRAWPLVVGGALALLSAGLTVGLFVSH